MRGMSVASTPRPMIRGTGTPRCSMSLLMSIDIRPQPRDGFDWIATPAGPALVCRPLEAVAHHFYTTRLWRLGTPTETDAERQAGWRQVTETAGAGADRLARLRQVHGASVVIKRAGEPHDASALPAADIIVSGNSTLVLAVQAADCVPMLLADRRTGIVAAAHAGWRGLAAGVPSAAVRAMADAFHTRPGDLVVAIGPSISAERYEVGWDVRAAFARAFANEHAAAWFPRATREGHWLFDGWKSASDQLIEAGVPVGQVHVAGLCTATYPDLLCSYRRDAQRAGRLAAAIWRRAT